MKLFFKANISLYSFNRKKLLVKSHQSNKWHIIPKLYIASYKDLRLAKQNGNLLMFKVLVS